MTIRVPFLQRDMGVDINYVVTHDSPRRGDEEASSWSHEGEHVES